MREANQAVQLNMLFKIRNACGLMTLHLAFLQFGPLIYCQTFVNEIIFDVKKRIAYLDWCIFPYNPMKDRLKSTSKIFRGFDIMDILSMSFTWSNEKIIKRDSLMIINN